MNILIVKLCIVFLVIIAILWLKKPLFMAITGGLVVAVLLYGVPLGTALVIMGKSMISESTITVVLSFYFITLLQRMLERRKRLKQAEEALNVLFNNRRINASLAPSVIGLLPSAGAMTICADMVDSACQDYLSKEDMTCVTSFYRHIPESFLPTYSSILIALALTGIGAGQFVVAMLPLVAVLFLIGYGFYLRKVPKRTDHQSEGHQGQRGPHAAAGSVVHYPDCVSDYCLQYSGLYCHPGCDAAECAGGPSELLGDPPHVPHSL